MEFEYLAFSFFMLLLHQKQSSLCFSACRLTRDAVFNVLFIVEKRFFFLVIFFLKLEIRTNIMI